MFAHNRLAASPAAQDKQLWVASPGEAAAIADPLASIAERHGLAKAANPDTSDLIAAGIGLLSYLVENLGKAVYLRLAARRHPVIIRDTSNPTPDA